MTTEINMAGDPPPVPYVRPYAVKMTPTPAARKAIADAIAWYEAHPDKFTFANATVPFESLDDPDLRPICPLALIAKLMGFSAVRELGQDFYQQDDGTKIGEDARGNAICFWFENAFFADIEVAGNDLYARWKYSYDSMMANMRALLAMLSPQEVISNG